MARPDTDIARQAAAHFLLLQDPTASGKAIKASLAWIDRNEEHRAATEDLSRLWSVCDDIASHLPTEAADLVTDCGSVTVARSRSWASFLPVAASFVVCLAVATAIWWGLSDGIFAGRPSLARYSTAVGEIRTVQLEDGSRVTLGGASGLTVDFRRDVRRVALTDGQAFFVVAKDPKRPFVVASGAGSVRAIGTEFDVSRTLKGATVTVLEGVVRVSGGPDGGAKALEAGMQVSYNADGQLSPVAQVDARMEAQWRAGVLRFVNEPMAAVIADINRYSTKPVSLDSQRLADVKVTGLLRVDGIDEWLAGVSKAIGASVVETSAGIVLRDKATPVQQVTAKEAAAS